MLTSNLGTGFKVSPITFEILFSLSVTLYGFLLLVGLLGLKQAQELISTECKSFWAKAGKTGKKLKGK
jgi:hypothetical protein